MLDICRTRRHFTQGNALSIHRGRVPLANIADFYRSLEERGPKNWFVCHLFLPFVKFHVPSLALPRRCSKLTSFAGHNNNAAFRTPPQNPRCFNPSISILRFYRGNSSTTDGPYTGESLHFYRCCKFGAQYLSNGHFTQGNTVSI